VQTEICFVPAVSFLCVSYTFQTIARIVTCLKLGHDCFLPDPLLPITHCFILRLVASDEVTYFFYLLEWSGTYRNYATKLPIIPATVDGEWCLLCSRWNGWQGKPKYAEETCSNPPLSTTNPTWPDLGWNLGRRCKNPGSNRLSYDTVAVTLII
jgi:hypothetical protein